MFFNQIIKELNRLRRKSNCYLLSSKLVLTIAMCLLSYFITMDIILYKKIKARGLNTSITTTPTTTITTSNAKYNPFSPLPVKKIMMADATHFIRSPLAELIESKLHFSETFPFVSANSISILHCLISIVCIRFFISDSLFQRQLGVVLFQFRNFLDSFDGVLYRAHAKKLVYKSHYGSMGYFVDAFSDVFGGICIIGSVAIYLLKNPPPNKRLTRCFRLINNNHHHYHGLNDLDLDTNEKQPYGMHEQQQQQQQQQFASKAVILISILSLGIRFGLSALFWDRSVHTYEDLLDSTASNELHHKLQTNVLHSPITIFIMFLWRFMCALSVQDMILTAIFIDKIWEFIVKTQFIAWLVLILLVILTELHVSEIRSILVQASSLSQHSSSSVIGIH